MSRAEAMRREYLALCSEAHEPRAQTLAWHAARAAEVEAWVKAITAPWCGDCRGVPRCTCGTEDERSE